MVCRRRDGRGGPAASGADRATPTHSCPRASIPAGPRPAKPARPTRRTAALRPGTPRAFVFQPIISGPGPPRPALFRTGRCHRGRACDPGTPAQPDAAAVPGRMPGRQGPCATHRRIDDRFRLRRRACGCPRRTPVRARVRFGRRARPAKLCSPRPKCRGDSPRCLASRWLQPDAHPGSRRERPHRVRPSWPRRPRTVAELRRPSRPGLPGARLAQPDRP